jgi:hypothetical protein
VGDDLGFGVFFLGLAAVGLLFARRLTRTGLWLGADGIVVRNPLRTVSVPIDDADSFITGVARGGTNGTPCPLLRRRHGSAVGVWALGREGVVWRFGRYERGFQPLCDELNAVLQSLKAECGPEVCRRAG